MGQWSACTDSSVTLAKNLQKWALISFTLAMTTVMCDLKAQEDTKDVKCLALTAEIVKNTKLQYKRSYIFRVIFRKDAIGDVSLICMGVLSTINIEFAEVFPPNSSYRLAAQLGALLTTEKAPILIKAIRTCYVKALAKHGGEDDAVILSTPHATLNCYAKLPRDGTREGGESLITIGVKR